jgi:hypothetical protein
VTLSSAVTSLAMSSVLSLVNTKLLTQIYHLILDATVAKVTREPHSSHA